jgi:hypothetical protein
VGSATNQLHVVTPDDLQMASQMYGQVSDRFFNIANNMGMSLNYIHSDRHRILEQEGVMKARDDIEGLMSNAEVVNDDKKLKEAISYIADKHTKDAGYYVGGRRRYIINNEFGLEKRMQVSQNRVNIEQEKTRLDNKDLLYRNLHEIYMSKEYTSEQKLGIAIKEKEKIFNNDFLYSPKMHADADKKIQNLKNTQDFIDGRIDKVLDKADIDHKYLDALLDRHDSVFKAEKLSMTFQQSKIYSDIKNRKDGWQYYQKNRTLLDKDQRDDLDRYFKVTRGKGASMSEWKSYWSNENLMNKTHQDLTVASRGDPKMMNFLVNERDRQRRQADDNKDLITKFNTSLGLPDVDKIKDTSPEHLTMINNYGYQYKEKIHAMQNKLIDDRSEMMLDPNNLKNPKETRILYEDKKLPAMLANLKEELRQQNINLQQKRNSLVEKQKKLMR